MDSQGKTPRLLDQVRQVMRLHHYSLHTERAYVDWIKRYVRFHQMQRREDLAGGEAKIEAFLTDLAVNGHVAPATQNQAMNALVFLYKRVLEVPLDQAIQAVRADRKANVPVVLTREEVAKVIPLVDGVAHLVVKLLYGSGLRIMEAVRLRVKDVDVAMKQITVRSGKGDKDRVTTFPASLIPLIWPVCESPQRSLDGAGYLRAEEGGDDADSLVADLLPVLPMGNDPLRGRPSASSEVPSAVSGEQSAASASGLGSQRRRWLIRQRLSR